MTSNRQSGHWQSCPTVNQRQVVVPWLRIQVCRAVKASSLVNTISVLDRDRHDYWRRTLVRRSATKEIRHAVMDRGEILPRPTALAIAAVQHEKDRGHDHHWDHDDADPKPIAFHRHCTPNAA